MRSVRSENVVKTVVCPRCCLDKIPCNERAGEYPGALSRADNETEICSACGQDEALGEFLEHYLAPVSVWPVKRRYEVTVLPPEAEEQLRKLQEEADA